MNVTDFCKMFQCTKCNKQHKIYVSFSLSCTFNVVQQKKKNYDSLHCNICAIDSEYKI